VVVISHRLWQEELGGDPNAVGRPFTMSGRTYTIAGVMPEGFSDPIAGAVDAWMPQDLREGKDASQVDNHYLTIIARLRPQTEIARAQAELDALGLALAAQYPNAKDSRARLYPLKEDIVGSSSRALEIMLGAVGLVLLLVCVNIANLLLVRGSERAHEFALRSALGADRSRLVRQMLIESITLAVAGAVASLVVARLAMSAIVVLGAGTIPRLDALSLDPRAPGVLLHYRHAERDGLRIGARAARVAHTTGRCASRPESLSNRAASGRCAYASGSSSRRSRWRSCSSSALVCF
jgi:putative ABC transport system permease protein